MAHFPSEQVARNRSTSTGASGLPQHERKRPRLDTTPELAPESSQHSQSVMAATTRSHTVSPQPMSRAPSRPQTPSSTSTAAEPELSVVSPTSKVTINTRSLSAQSTNHDIVSISSKAGSETKAQPSNENTSKTESPVIVDISDGETSKAAPGEADEPITVSSSPSEVFIEIGEPEDIEDDLDNSNWSPSSSAESGAKEGRMQAPIWRSFPFNASGLKSDVLVIIQKAADVFERDFDEQFPNVLDEISKWMATIQHSLSRQTLQSFTEELDIYQHLPFLMVGLLKRKIAIPFNVTEEDLLHFSKLFAYTTMHMINFDIMRLQSLDEPTTATSPPCLVSQDYVRYLVMLLSPSNGCHLHATLRQSRRIQEKDFLTRIAVTLFQDDPEKPFQALSLLFAEFTQKIPSASPDRGVIPSLVNQYRTLLNAITLHKVSVSAQQLDSLQQITYQFVTRADEALQQAIIKQHPWLTIENNGSCLDHFSRLTSVSVMMFPDIAKDVFRMARVQCSSAESNDLVDLAQQAFRLATLRLLIQHGRMELRVYGIEAMAQLLVGIWTQAQQAGIHRRQSLVELVVEFLRNNEVVKYILGVDSHPQIVQRSPNVIGFLCVSNNWGTSDSDIAWQAILDSQDHRSAAAVVDNLKANLQHLNLVSLLYLHHKLLEFPFEKFDNRMLMYSLQLLEYTIAKTGRIENREHAVAAATVRLSLHLLREANIPSRCSTEIAEQVRLYLHDFLTKEKQNTTGCQVLDLTETERDTLLTEVSTDIKNHSDYATGSIIVITALLSSLDDLSAARVVAKYDLVDLLLDDMVAIVKNHGLQRNASDRTLETQYQIRLSCILTLIVKIPAVFTEESSSYFWTNVLTSALPSAIRSRAWSTLAEAYRKVSSINPFLEYVAGQFMHNLPVELLDKAVLDFAKESVEFELRNTFSSINDVDKCLQIPSMERVWRVLLQSRESNLESAASDYVIQIYLDGEILTKRNPMSIEKTHAALVDRCIQTVIQSAQGLKASEAYGYDLSSHRANTISLNLQTNQYENCLYRSLSLLRKFLDGLKSRPRYRPAASETLGPVLKTFQKKGETLEIFLRVNNHPQIRNEQLLWTVGEDNTGHEIWQFLVEVTGWSQLNFIKGGARLQLRDNETALKDLKEIRIQPGPINVSKAFGAADIGPSRAIRASSPVDSKVMHHFEELYALLDSHDTIAKAIYEFLTMFSSQEIVLSTVKSMGLSAQALLPVQKPFKLLYFATALRSCIEEESFSPSPNVEFLQYAVHTITTTLHRMQSVKSDPSLSMKIIRGIIETLLLALRAKVPEAASKTYFRDHESFIKYLLESWEFVQTSDKVNGSESEIHTSDRDFFDAVIEASLHDERMWQYIDQKSNFQELFAYAILSNTNATSRQSVREIILRLAGTSSGKASLKANDLRAPRSRFSAAVTNSGLSHLWQYLYPLAPRAIETPACCQEVLEASIAVFETVSRKLDQQTLTATMADLESLLLAQHDPLHGIYCSNEHLPLGLARLVSQCISALLALGVTLPRTVDLIRSIYQQFLFPPLSSSATACITKQSTPLVDAETRSALYDLIIALSSSGKSLTAIAAEMVDCAVDKDAFAFQSMNERKSLRSDQGYAGLRNLSNTCYLNSLFSQLFMNVDFRQLLLDIRIVDEAKQKLVVEMATVFANMQSSYEKYVSPEEAVESITQYTGEQIDVTVQMDVDEFFNLLFDRLETQIIDPGARETFKSMYGGQLVQQIKSKECEHVSERLEPFSAVQIEIKGKSGLEEGLSAYVEGEVLQGENKYSCTSCGRHVDAVKRACLKEVPDHLIFNLKRFDYDIMTGMRCKVNDEFQFPEHIDMMPYTVDALSNPDHGLPPDMFELVGVIIHSGTAETGHYYSFIRQRPSSRTDKNSWVQFNDQDVSRFDPEQMRDQAFGGCDQSFNSLSKFYNGYMLFYQRTSSIQDHTPKHPANDSHVTGTVPLPQDLDNRIAQENEICLRRYVAQDPSHAKFIRQVAERMRTGNETCSVSHGLEDQILAIVLDYVQQVSSRWKEMPEFEDTLKILCGYATNCSKCALNIIEWFGAGENMIVNMLRAWYPLARKHFANCFVICYGVLSKLQYPEHINESIDLDHKRLKLALTKCLQKVIDDWTALQRSPRGWEHLFGALNSIARLGPLEASTMIELNYLEKVLEIVWIHVNAVTKITPRSIRQKYNIYLAARERNRLFNHGVVMELFAELLPYIGLGDRIPGKPNRPHCLDASENEHELLGLGEDGSFDWLRRLISGGSNDEAPLKVVCELCNYPSLAEKIGMVLTNGVVQTRQYAVAARFLQPCEAFVLHSPDKRMVWLVIRDTLKAVKDTDGYHGSDYLDYVKALMSVDQTVCGFNQQRISDIVIASIEHWAPALLMSPNDMHRDVRTEALMLVEQILAQLESLQADEIRSDENKMALVRNLLHGCAAYAHKQFVEVDRERQQRQTLGSGQASQVLKIMETCKVYLDGDNADDEAQANELQGIIDELQLLEQSNEASIMDEWRDRDSSNDLSELESYQEGGSPP